MGNLFYTQTLHVAVQVAAASLLEIFLFFLRRMSTRCYLIKVGFDDFIFALQKPNCSNFLAITEQIYHFQQYIFHETIAGKHTQL